MSGGSSTDNGAASTPVEGQVSVRVEGSPRILYLVSRFPKTTETFIVNEALGMVERGFDVHIRSLSGTDETTLHSAARAMAPNVELASRRPGRLLGSLLRWAWRAPRRSARIWARVLVTHWRSPGLLLRTAYATLVGFDWADELAAADHVHAHWATYPAHIAWVAHRLTGLRYSVTAHAHDIQLSNPMMADKLGEAAFTVTISDHNRRVLLERVGPSFADRLHVVRCGVDTAGFRPSDRDRTLGEGRPFTVVSVASFLAYKGHVVLLDALAQVVARTVDGGGGRDSLRLRLIGDGELRPVIEARIAQLGLEPVVELLGWRGADEVRNMVGAADAFVLASIVTAEGQTEGIPVALMEAMALGIPVIATQVSGVPELVIDGETGILVPHSDPAALARAVNAVIADPVAAAARAVAGRARVERMFDAERNTDRLAELFSAVITGAALPPPTAPEPTATAGVQG